MIPSTFNLVSKYVWYDSEYFCIQLTIFVNCGVSHYVYELWIVIVMSKFGANVIRLAISLHSFSKQCFKVVLLDSSDPLSSKILISVNVATTQATG